MNILKRFVSGLGQQTAPFGFAPEDPNASYQAGLSYIGDIGANLMANNQGGVDPFANLGASMQQAKQSGVQRNKEQYTAQRLMEEAAYKKQEREQAQAEIQKKNEWLKGISDPKYRAMLEANPGLIDDYIAATDPAFQRPETPNLTADMQNFMFAQENPEFAGFLNNGKSASDGIMGQVSERQAAAEAMGLSPEDPAYRSYILTGKMPREDQAPLTAGDKAAIRDADSAVLMNKTVIKQLRSVIGGEEGKTLNDRAGSGMFANVEAVAARNDPTGLLDAARGQATTDLQNIILNQALGSMKTIFGGNPTEGERAILVELQASVDKTPAERKGIIERAITLAEERLKFNEDVANGLRGETYYKPGGGPTDDGWTDVGNGVRIRQKGR